jgi:hypothetical protein
MQGLRRLDATSDLSPSFNKRFSFNQEGSGEGGGECISRMNRSGGKGVVQFYGKQGSRGQNLRPRRFPEREASS